MLIVISVCGVHSDKVKERLLRDNELTLIKALCICRANEESQSRMKDLQQEEQVSAVKTNSLRNRLHEMNIHFRKLLEPVIKKPMENRYTVSKLRFMITLTCGKCGKSHCHCQAFGKICRKCHRKYHCSNV